MSFKSRRRSYSSTPRTCSCCSSSAVPVARCVTVGSYTGKAAKAVEQIGAVTAQARTSRHADTPLISTPHDARWVSPRTTSGLTRWIDQLRMLIDPTSPTL